MALTKAEKDIKKLLDRNGIAYTEIVPTENHTKVLLSNGKTMVCSKSPSDVRARHNILKIAKRLVR